MDRFFEVITKIDRLLRQRYEHLDIKPRTFWNQTMVVAGLIKLEQSGLALNHGNLARDTPIPSSSIYRTLTVLEAYNIIKRKNNNATDYELVDIPKDIRELNTISKQTIDTNTLLAVIKPVLKSTIENAMAGLQIDKAKIDEVTRRIDDIKEEELSETDKLFGEGSFM